MRTAIFKTASLAVGASRVPFAVWNLLTSKPVSRCGGAFEADCARDAGLRSRPRPDGLEAFDFLRGWKGLE
jgi:hypothetical protein